MLAIKAAKDSDGSYDTEANHGYEDSSSGGHKEVVRVGAHPNLALTVRRTSIANSHLQHRRVDPSETLTTARYCAPMAARHYSMKNG
jgi:hypothetical protein